MPGCNAITLVCKNTACRFIGLVQYCMFTRCRHVKLQLKSLFLLFFFFCRIYKSCGRSLFRILSKGFQAMSKGCLLLFRQHYNVFGLYTKRAADRDYFQAYKIESDLSNRDSTSGHDRLVLIYQK